MVTRRRRQRSGRTEFACYIPEYGLADPVQLKQSYREFDRYLAVCPGEGLIFHVQRLRGEGWVDEEMTVGYVRTVKGTWSKYDIAYTDGGGIVVLAAAEELAS